MSVAAPFAQYCARLRDELAGRDISYIAVAMSGGVDSTIAALLLKEAGFRVSGVTMHAGPGRPGPRCAAEAATAAAALGIPHCAVDVGPEFAAAVVAPYVEAYARGITPNPCVACNRRVKFGALLARARELGASHFATGHYARLAPSPGGRFILRRGRDPAKDQSYVLYALRQDELARAVFPLGEATKAEVRAFARQLGLDAADRPESQEACFIAGDYREFLRREAPRAFERGPIVDRAGNLLGEHAGLARYTVGQRRGIGLGGARAASARAAGGGAGHPAGGRPLYVVELDSARNAVVVGGHDELLARGLIARELNFIPFDQPLGPLACAVATRYRGREAPATVEVEGDAARVTFAAPQGAITPGQSAVFYDGDVVVGGGTIAAATR